MVGITVESTVVRAWMPVRTGVINAVGTAS